MRTICDKRFVEGRRKTCVRGGGCVHGAFNVETVEGKVGRLASNVQRSFGPNIGGAVYAAIHYLSPPR